MSRIERLRLWLIVKLAGDIPVLLNFQVTVPPDLGKPGVYLGRPGLVAIVGHCASDAALWEHAKGVIESSPKP